jgi:hypothetical protein
MGNSIGIVLQPFPVRGPDDFKAAFLSIAAAGFQAVSIIHDSILTAAVKPLADLEPVLKGCAG